MPARKRYTVTVEERPDSPCWQARMYLEGEGGRARRWSTGVPVGNDRRVSEREATRAAEERADEIAREVISEVATDDTTSLESVADAMLAQKQADGRRKRAIEALGDNLVAHVLPYFGPDRDVRTIRRRDLEAFKADLIKHGYKPTTINNCLTAIRQVLKHACNVMEAIEAVPFVGNVPVPKRSTVAMPLTEEQANKFLRSFAADQQEEREFNLFLLRTGLRKTEALAIRWDWIDWDRCELRVPAEVRKGGKPQRHPTALDDVAVALLEERKARPQQPSKGRVWWQLDSYDDARRAAAKKAGVAGYRHHDARHTRATWMGAAGATEMDLRDAMNWETTAMASRYTHPNRDRLHTLAGTVGASVTGGMKQEEKHGKEDQPTERTARTRGRRRLRSVE